ncbi:MAG: hypothetical protein AAB036_04745 [Elusimicrobiota bacterium]
MNSQTPPSLAELFRYSMRALVDAPGTFAALGLRPPPRRSFLFLLALSWGASFFLLNLARLLPTQPALWTGASPWQLAATALCGLVLWMGLWLLAAALLHGLGRMLGAAGHFDRALLLAAFVALAAPVLGISAWFSHSLIVPALLAAQIASCGLHALFAAGAWPARAVCALLAAAAVAVQMAATERLHRSVPAAALAEAANELGGGLRAIDLDIAQLPNASSNGSADGRSGLDLLRSPSDASPTEIADQNEQLQRAVAEGADMNRSVVAMLDSLGPIIKNSVAGRDMTPRQRADFAELTKMIDKLKKTVASGHRVTPDEQREQMLKIQELTMRMMSSGLGAAGTSQDKR